MSEEGVLKKQKSIDNGTVVCFLMRECGVTTVEEAKRWKANPLACIQNQVDPWLMNSSWYRTERLTTAPLWEPEYDGKPVSFMLRFAHMWVPSQLPIPENQPLMAENPAHVVRCTGFPRLYTYLMNTSDDDDDAFLMLIKSGNTPLVDRVMIHLTTEHLLRTQRKSHIVQQDIMHWLGLCYGQPDTTLVGWLLHQRYGNGVFEAALFHAIGLPYMVHLRRPIPAQTWPAIGNKPIRGYAAKAWSMAIRANQWKLSTGEPMGEALFIDIGLAFQHDSVDSEKRRDVPTALTFTLVLRWLLGQGQGRTAFQMARTCRMGLWCYHSILIPTDWGPMMRPSDVKHHIMNRYFGDEDARFVSSNASGFTIDTPHRGGRVTEDYHVPEISDASFLTMDPYMVVARRLSRRRIDICAVACRALAIGNNWDKSLFSL